MKFIEGTTRKTLNSEYLRWLANYGRSAKQPPHLGRAFNLGQLRFGQYFWNEYGAANESWPEFFYEESPEAAYMLAFYELREEQAS